MHESDLDQALAVRSSLDSDVSSEIWVSKFPDLMELLYELNDFQRSATPELASILRTNTSLLNKLLNQKAPIPIHVARTVADNLVTHLRSSIHRSYIDYEKEPSHTPTDLPHQKEEKAFSFFASEWVVVVRSDELTKKINQLIALVGEVVQHATTCNLPSKDRVLTEIERSQLIAVLETALNMLKSPMLEKGLLRKATGMLKRAGEKAAEKQVEIAFSTAAGAATGALISLLSHL